MTDLKTKIEELKASQKERAGQLIDYRVDAWDVTLKIKKATLSDQEKSGKFAKRHFRHLETEKGNMASGAALICIVCAEGLELTKENVQFLLDEPAEAIMDIIREINQLAGINV